MLMAVTAGILVVLFIVVLIWADENPDEAKRAGIIHKGKGK